jgi:hypothetical protein
MLVFKHEAILIFVDRLVRDREFAEWFVAGPEQALASYSLTTRDLRDVADVLDADRYQPELAQALQPTLRCLLGLIDEARLDDAPDRVPARCTRLSEELTATRERLSVARARRRPWWKFW